MDRPYDVREVPQTTHVPPPLEMTAPPAMEPQAPVAQAAAAPAPQSSAFRMQQQANSASVWLFMIAGFTLFNGIMWLDGQNLRMVIGLMATRLFTKVIVGAGAPGLALEMVVVVLASVAFAVLGWFTRKQRRWAWIAGAVIYTADLALMLALVGTADGLGLAFHAFTAYVLIVGIVNFGRLKAGGEAIAVDGPPTRWSFVIGIVVIVLAVGALLGLGIFAVTDVMFGVGTGVPTTGAWSASILIYTIGLVVVACFGYVGFRLLASAKRVPEPGGM